MARRLASVVNRRGRRAYPRAYHRHIACLDAPTIDETVFDDLFVVTVNAKGKAKVAHLKQYLRPAKIIGSFYNKTIPIKILGNPLLLPAIALAQQPAQHPAQQPAQRPAMRPIPPAGV